MNSKTRWHPIDEQRAAQLWTAIVANSATPLPGKPPGMHIDDCVAFLNHRGHAVSRQSAQRAICCARHLIGDDDEKIIVWDSYLNRYRIALNLADGITYRDMRRRDTYTRASSVHSINDITFRQFEESPEEELATFTEQRDKAEQAALALSVNGDEGDGGFLSSGDA